MATRRYHKKRVSKKGRKSRKSRRLSRMGGAYFSPSEQKRLFRFRYDDKTFKNGNEIIYKTSTRTKQEEYDDYNKISEAFPDDIIFIKWNFNKVNSKSFGIFTTNTKNFLITEIPLLYDKIFNDTLKPKLEEIFKEEIENMSINFFIDKIRIEYNNKSTDIKINPPLSQEDFMTNVDSYYKKNPLFIPDRNTPPNDTYIEVDDDARLVPRFLQKN